MKIKKFLLVTLLAVLTSIALTSCTQPERPLSATELLNLGERYLIELNFEQALVHFTTVIEIEPMNTRAYLGGTDALLSLNRIPGCY